MDEEMPQMPSQESHLACIKEALEKSCYGQVKNYFTTPEILDWSVENAVETTRTLALYIDPAKEATNPGLGATCRWMLLKLMEALKNPDEVYLELLSNMDVLENDFLLLTMLQCAEVCLGKMTESRPRSLTWLLMSLKDTLVEIRDKASDSEDSDVEISFIDIEDRLLALYTAIETFYLTYINNLDAPDNHTAIAEQKQQLSVFLLNQLIYTDLPKPFIVNFVSSLAKVLPHLGYPLIYLTERSTWKKNKTDTYHYLDEVTHRNSYEMLFYYMFCEGMSYDQFPQIYSPQFLFVNVGALSSNLLLNPDHYQEGLKLLHTVLNKVDNNSISHWALSCTGQYFLVKGLTKGMVYNSDLEVRKQSSKALKKLVFCYVDKGRYLFLYHSFRRVMEQGVRGYLVTFFKDFVTQYLNSECYFMQKLPELLSYIFVLPKGNKTMIHDWNDMIVSLLNFLRYLIAVDPKPGNRTGLWGVEEAISEHFMKPMSAALKYSRESLQKRQNDAEILPKTESDKAVVTIENEEVPLPKYQQEMEGIKLMLTHLDFVKYVFEIVQEKFPR